MNEEVIKKIYDKTKDVVINFVDEELQFLLENAYYEYLVENYGNFDLQEKNIDDVVKIFADLEISKWSNMSIDNRKSELLKDEAFENLRYISNVALKYAEQKVNSRDINGENMQNTLDEETANKYIEALNTYLPQVQDFNKQIADYFVSEGIMDLEFACGRTNYMSLRIGRYYK